MAKWKITYDEPLESMLFFNSGGMTQSITATQVSDTVVEMETNEDTTPVIDGATVESI